MGASNPSLADALGRTSQQTSSRRSRVQVEYMDTPLEAERAISLLHQSN